MKYIELYEGIFISNKLKKEVLDFVKSKEGEYENHSVHPKDEISLVEITKIKKSLKSLKSVFNFSFKIDKLNINDLDDYETNYQLNKYKSKVPPYNQIIIYIQFFEKRLNTFDNKEVIDKTIITFTISKEDDYYNSHIDYKIYKGKYNITGYKHIYVPQWHGSWARFDQLSELFSFIKNLIKLI